jgi:hypothetical protein
MSMATLIGLGYSGYAILNNIPILLLPSGTTEDEHLIMSEGSFHPDPANNTNQLVAYQRRSLNLSIQTIVSPRTWPLLKALTYSWRNQAQIDHVPEVPFTYVLASGEGFKGSGYVDDVTLTATPDQFLTMGIGFTAWLWEELGVSALPLTDPFIKLGPRVLSPFFDTMYKPIAGWNCPVTTSVISHEAILQQYSLKFANNWVYQTFLGGYPSPPNPGLISAGQLDVNLDISWVAARKDRPLNAGTFQFKIGGAKPGSVLDTMYIDYMVRGSKNFDGGGAPNQMINWHASYMCEGPIPRSTL